MRFKPNRRSALKNIAAGAAAMTLGRYAAAQEDTLKIAVIYPLTGPIAQLGNGMLTGARIAADQFNRTGGVLGKKIELVVRDDKASPAESALVAREVFGAGIRFVVGGLLTAPGMAIVNMLQENNALFVLTGSMIMSLTHENYNPNAFRSTINGRMSLFAVASAMPQEAPGITRWGSITPDNQFGTDNYRIFSTLLKRAYKEKGKVIDTSDPVLVSFPATDFKVQIAKLMSSPVEALYVGVVGTDYYTFMSQAKQLGLHNKIKVYVEAGTGVAAARGLGVAMPKDNLYSATSWYWRESRNPTSQALVKDYVALTKDTNPESSVFNGHTGMVALLTAIRNAKSLETPVVRVALERVEFEAANGPFHFRREDHQGVYNMQVLRMAAKSGDPGFEVTKATIVKGDDTLEPPGPGKKYTGD
jgi:branched-chain amino acid transport system substrate-binding protein